LNFAYNINRINFFIPGEQSRGDADGWQEYIHRERGIP